MIGVHDMVALRHGAMECLLAPGCGGSIAAWRRSGPDGTIDLFRPASEAAMAGDFAPDMACFPLIPFSNRVAGGRFTFQGRRVEMPTDPGSPHRIHGHGWAVPWRVEGQVEERTASAARLAFRHRADSWPWSYSAAQTVALDDDGLTVTLELVNESDSVMPAGFGLHPYFPKPPGTRVTARLNGMWESDETILPRNRRPLPPAWNFPKGVAMDGLVLDHGFTGWDGRAVLEWPGRGLSLTIVADGPFGHLIVYAPAGEDYLCLEPVSHMTDALNRPQEPDAGVIALPPGERLTGTVRFRVAAL
ncbi:aldose 1-epimerase [Azospirillum agricola]|uniref:aldose 1-epimerase n=1 Tax=Azospirillum agricola TaxID=1720247 RepID=UPI000A0F310E|nr:aldose 1-epimerase [Azospirillum agricola]SMH59675.1 aldose 1-epimerase [Azospirillum lipoferum]